MIYFVLLRVLIATIVVVWGVGYAGCCCFELWDLLLNAVWPSWLRCLDCVLVNSVVID